MFPRRRAVWLRQMHQRGNPTVIKTETACKAKPARNMVKVVPSKGLRQSVASTATRVAETKNAEEAQAESPERPRIPPEAPQAALDDNNQMVSEGGRSS